MAVVLPQGVLFRAAKEGKIRQMLIESDLLDTIIGLGPNLFYGTGLSACVLILRIQKPAKKSRCRLANPGRYVSIAAICIDGKGNNKIRRILL